MRTTFIGLWLMVPLFAWSGKLDKGYEALKVFDYFQAKTQFEAAYDKEPVGASYGLSLIYSRDDNPFYQPDSALRFILHADTLFFQLDEKSQATLFTFGIDSAEIAEQKQRVINYFYQRALASSWSDTLDLFIQNYPWFQGIEQAQLIRDSLAFEEASEADNWQAYQQFFMRYPYAKKVVDARNRYDRLFYEDHTQAGTLEVYEAFIRDYRMSPFLGEAQDEIYRLATTSGTVDQHHAFIRNYPENRNVNKAWMVIYKTSVKRNDPLEIAEFILDYPDYPYRNDALMDYNLSNTPFYPVVKDDLWGYVDDKGKQVVDCQYDFVDAFYEGAAQVGKGDWVGFINKKGELVVPMEYTDAGEYAEGFVWVEKDGKYGLADHLGKLVLELNYEDLGSFSDQRVYAQRNGKYGFYDDSLTLVIPFQFDYVSDFTKQRAQAQQGDFYGVIDTRGNWILSATYEWVELLPEEEQIRVKKDGKMGIFSWKGDTVIPVQYNHLGKWSEGRLLYVEEGKYGYLNRAGEKVIEAKYAYQSAVDAYALFENGAVKYYSVKKKYGLIDTNGAKVFPAIFDDVGSYSGTENQLTAVKRYGKWGYANTDVKLKIKYLYQQAGAFSFGLAQVKKGGKTGLINTDGAAVIPLEFDKIVELDQGLLLAQKEGLWGVMDRNNNPILPFIYEEIADWDANTWVLTIGNKRAYYDRKERSFIYQDDGMQISED